MRSQTSRQATPTIAIIGAGFGGLGMAIQLKRAGIHSFTIFEKEGGIGGVWRDNTYPGAGCDVPSPLYSFSFEPGYRWSRRFAPQPEILEYLWHCVKKYDLLEHIRFDTEIAGAAFDEPRGLWVLTTTDGESLEAGVLITACGQLSRPAYPDLPGLSSFIGKQFHSARWDHEYDLAGKSVAVIGTGASAIQFVPRIAPRVARLHLFQRSAPYIIPKPDQRYRGTAALVAALPGLRRIDRWLTYWALESLVLSFTRLQRLGAIFRRLSRHHLERQVGDLRLREALTPGYPIGCKRVLFSSDYYPAMTRPNVDLVTERITEVRRGSIVTADGRERHVDAIIHATGFTATDFLAPIRITGRRGRDLNQAWREGAEAYLGITVSGFPNLFLLYGPNTNLGHSSVVFMIESQVRYVLQCVRRLADHDRRILDVRPDVQRKFNAALQERLRGTVWSAGCSNWYQTESGRIVNNWPGFTFEYRRRTRRLDLNDYRVEAAAGG
jgi:cation diffusion facilitator CzcD-associated flavoprotein CzcO